MVARGIPPQQAEHQVGQDQTRGVDYYRDALRGVLTKETRGERNERYTHHEEYVDTGERPVPAFGVGKHIVAGDPTDAKDHKARNLAQETGAFPENLVAQVSGQFA